MDLLTAAISAIAGGIAGFAASYFFWEKDRKTFREKVLAIVSKIPRGRTLTYKEVAERAGNDKAARAVGAVMRTNFDPDIPCHRVIRSGGGIGGYNRGVKRKIDLLQSERVEPK